VRHRAERPTSAAPDRSIGVNHRHRYQCKDARPGTTTCAHVRKVLGATIVAPRAGEMIPTNSRWRCTPACSLSGLRKPCAPARAGRSPGSRPPRSSSVSTGAGWRLRCGRHRSFARRVVVPLACVGPEAVDVEDVDSGVVDGDEVVPFEFFENLVQRRPLYAQHGGECPLRELD
jgi:hypothetical protein